MGDSKTNVAITPNALTQAAAIAQNTYGFDAGSFATSSASELLVKDTLIKLDWTISDKHRANLRYAKTEQGEPIYPNISPTALSLSSNWYNQGKVLETTVGQWFADWTDTFSTELKVSKRDYESVPVNAVTRPQIGLNFINALPVGLPSNTPNNRTLFLGTERSRHFNVLGTKTTDVYAAGNLALGAHELKFGADISKNEIYNAFLQDTLGNYTFRCINSSTTFTYSFGAINCATATATQIEQATLENFQRGRPFTYQVQVPATGKTLDDGVARWNLTNTGLFLQDTFEVNKQLTIMGGVRVDTQSTGSRPLANAAASAAPVAGNAATNTRQTGGFGLDNTVTLDGEQLVQPRLGFNFNLDPANKRKAQVRGGFGLFQGAAASVWLSNPFSNTGVATRVVGCGGSFPACPGTDGLFNADPTKQPTSFPGTPPAANVDFIEKGLGQPSVWKFNLALDAELPWYGIVAGAEWLHTKTKQGIYYRHLNLGTVTRTGTDGRELYYNANGYNTNCWTAAGATNAGGAGCGGAVTTRALSNSAFNNVLVASKTGLGGGDTVTFSLSQQPTRELSWSAAYTRSTATEVSPLTSSVSNSNWAARSVFNPNEEVAANSPYLVRDRVNAFRELVEGLHRHLPHDARPVLRRPQGQALQLDLQQRPERRWPGRQRPDVHPDRTGFERGRVRGRCGRRSPLLEHRRCQPRAEQGQGQRGQAQRQLLALREHLRPAHQPGSPGLQAQPEGRVHLRHPERRQPDRPPLGPHRRSRLPIGRRSGAQLRELQGHRLHRQVHLLDDAGGRGPDDASGQGRVAVGHSGHGPLRVLSPAGAGPIRPCPGR